VTEPVVLPLLCAELVELLGEYLEGTLPPGSAQALEEHLRWCRGCSAALDQLRNTVGLLGQLSIGESAPDELPADVRAGLVAAFEELRRGGR
jgi:anti-sigma factor RsiW